MTWSPMHGSTRRSSSACAPPWSGPSAVWTDSGSISVRTPTSRIFRGFTGAGLNLTLPNVVGFDNIVKGIAQVWASPFTARAFAWRQSRMEHPEDVYPAVLMLKSVPNDKSGVMVTADIDTGDTGVLSVAVNEGVGGAVDGQSAESLRIDTRDGSVRVLAMATAPWRRMPAPGGGIETLPVSGNEAVLRPAEIRQLIQLRQRVAAALSAHHRRCGQAGARGYRVRLSQWQTAALPAASLPREPPGPR